MRWSYIALSLSLISAGSLNAQQMLQNAPAAPMQRGAVQHVAPDQIAQRNQPGAVQQMQNELRARAVERNVRDQGGVPTVANNNRDQRQQMVPGDEQNRGDQMQGHGDPSGMSDAMMYGGGAYSSGGGGGVISLEQGKLMGIADGLRGLGEFNKNTATANVLTQEAHEKAIQNRSDEVQAYFAARQLNREQRNAARGPVPTHEEILRYSQSALPERLSNFALDRQTGAIHWPAALMRPEFNEHRARLEQIFQGRSYYNSGVASESYLEIKEEANSMLATLQDSVRETEPTAYIQARKFIAGLGYEGRFPAGHERVAIGR